MQRPGRAATIGVGISLVIHMIVVISLAIFAITRGAPAPEIVVFSEFGNPGGDTVIDPSLDASLPEVGGREAPPLEFLDPNQALSPEGINFIPGDALRGAVNGTGTGDGRGSGEGTGDGTGSGIGVPAVNVPSFAITKGSFSAWTEPRDPEPNRQYIIVIQVRLPKTIREYRSSDLTGMVIGTDLYKQAIRFKSTEKFPVADGAVEVRIPVPGAAKLVRDTIRIESRLLREKQTIHIEF